MGDSKSAGVLVLLFPSIFTPLIIFVLLGLKILVLRFLTDLRKLPYLSLLYVAVAEAVLPAVVLFVSMPLNLMVEHIFGDLGFFGRGGVFLAVCLVGSYLANHLLLVPHLKNWKGKGRFFETKRRFTLVLGVVQPIFFYASWVTLGWILETFG